MIDNSLLLAFYGDDFTGSTDALEFLSRAGVKTVLFIEPPTPEQLARHKGLQAVGVAGKTRSMAPAEMEQVLMPAFKALKALNTRHVHYKVCSTFDSSPSIGSIGKAIDIGAGVFAGSFIPLLVGAPALGRYCVFGNLFARMGIGSLGRIHRLDRHPSMSKHPVTPADESDIRLHLARQTDKNVALIDILDVERTLPELRELVNDHVGNGAEVLLVDALYPRQMPAIGKLIDSFADETSALFSVGSSGVEMALGAYWSTENLLATTNEWETPEVVSPILVASGSCSPVSGAQIRYALSKGFEEVVIDTSLFNGDETDLDLSAYVEEATAFILQGISVIVHTGGSEVISNQQTPAFDTGYVFGTALGRIVREVATNTAVKRVVLAGGDTSSYAARAMGIESVEMTAPLSPGAPLCRAYAPGSPSDGVEVNFKGGQVGKEDYFEMVARGAFV
ncbi:four-carbon acid sugar kinase family protein [Segetibacter sp. 3557_3]|uniref:four-carbon acid sugar kinase family protein n=1 Tax=Segetibacter sp. 3557_3 TaxID=2547429 RepID=UPI001058537E|nr:four-carbon acid sugar kinase family protein [Segetibacter sp. 3557_3]TDH27470.1 four-carbon acid sugar kinase family protein [Segetibacter sp. 3557_3]